MNKQDIRRIGDTVRDYERTPYGQSLPSNARKIDNRRWFFARIKNITDDNGTTTYEFIEQQIQEDGIFEDSTNGREDTAYPIPQSAKFEVDDIVRVDYGFDSTGKVHYYISSGGVSTQPIYGEITDATPYSDNRWVYNFKQVHLAYPGYGGWAYVSNGIQATCYNMIEDKNSSSGMLGNGIHTDSLIANGAQFELMPIPTGTIVRLDVFAFQNTDDTDPENPVTTTTYDYWCQYENGIDGGCLE